MRRIKKAGYIMIVIIFLILPIVVLTEKTPDRDRGNN